MEFSELKSNDRYNAFQNYISVKEAKETGIIPVSYHTIFKDRCLCGSENIVRLSDNKENADAITSVQCCNPRCYIKLAGNLAQMMRKYEISDFGFETAKELISYTYPNLEHKSHLDVLLLNGEDLPYLAGSRITALGQLVTQLVKSKQSLAQLLSSIGIPQWDSSIYPVAKDFSSVIEIVDAINKAGDTRNFLAQYGIRSIQKIYYFEEYIPDMYIAEYIIGQANIRKKAIRSIKIAITGELYFNGKRTTKSEYINILNDISVTKDGIQIFEFTQTSGAVTAPYVVADLVSTSAKYLTGKRNNTLITSNQLYDKIKKVVNEYNV